VLQSTLSNAERSGLAVATFITLLLVPVISIANSTTSCGGRFCSVTAGDVNCAAQDRI